eukprot:3481940-Pleurochrysis_carterae.AAC.7
MPNSYHQIIKIHTYAQPCTYAQPYCRAQATNNFVRYWHLNYGLFSYRGEPKHGLWKWTVPGAKLPIWWCDLGNFNEGSTSRG